MDIEEVDESHIDGQEAGQTVERDDSVATFGGHAAPVYAVALNKATGNLIASGGGDDLIHMWVMGEESVVKTLRGKRKT